MANQIKHTDYLAAIRKLTERMVAEVIILSDGSVCHENGLRVLRAAEETGLIPSDMAVQIAQEYSLLKR